MNPSYKYATIKAELRRRIETGELKPHDRLLTQSEIIAKYATSPTTAGRVLNELAFEGYAYRVKGRGTFVADWKPRNKKLCYCAPYIVKDKLSMSYPASSSILLDHIYNECRTRDWAVQLHISNPDPTLRAQSLADSINGVDGVILCQSFKPGIEEEIAVLKSAGVPFVVLDTYIQDPGINIVSTDSYTAAHDLTMQLYKSGCQTIVFWGREDSNADESMLVRRKGYAQAMRKLGMEEFICLHSIIPEVFERETEVAVGRILNSQGPIGILSDHIGHTQGLCNCIMKDKRPTRELILADFDDHPIMLNPPVPIYSMSRPFQLMAQKSIDRILAAAGGQGGTSHEFLESRMTLAKTVKSLNQQIHFHEYGKAGAASHAV